MQKTTGISKSFFYVFLALIIFCLGSSKVEATSAKFHFSSNNTVYNGNEITVNLAVTGITGGKICGISGNVNFDSSALQYVSGSGMSSPFNVQIVPNNNYKYAGVDMALNGFTSNATVLTLKFKALKLGSTSISLSNASFNDCSNARVNVAASKSISIQSPPSGNANLASLSVSGQNLNFNTNTTSYNLNVDTSVSNVTINAAVADGGARVSGIGTKSLRYGNNAFKVVVTAASGATKTYTINVNRKDSRSNNNYLNSLTIGGGSLEPNFDKNILSYALKVPYEISDLNVKATALDGKARVVIENNIGLISEETRNVIVKVIAENGEERTYTISVTRGKDPNKALSNNNYLSSLTTDIGLLSPVFDKEKLEYVIHLPFEVDKIKLTALKEDNKYASLKTTGPETLEIGNNKYTFEVIAEDNTSRTYTVTVIRAKSIDSFKSSSLLKEINITSGKLTKTFDKNVFEYTYIKSKDFKIEAIAEDSNSKVTVIDKNDIIIILVEATDGQTSTYILKLKSINILPIIGGIGSVMLIGGGTYLGYNYGLKNKKPKKQKKTKNDTIPKS